MQLTKWGKFIRFKLILLLRLQAGEQIIIAILKLLELRWLITPEAYDWERPGTGK